MVKKAKKGLFRESSYGVKEGKAKKRREERGGGGGGGENSHLGMVVYKEV